MCGIAGWVTSSAGPENPALLATMTNRLHHRGPDDAGYYEDDFAHLGHRRLRIIDLAGGGQPMSNEDGTVWIVFNGEIFNYQELRANLTRHLFRTSSDTEVIVHLYEEYGESCVDHLRGQFAFALWDSKKSQLVLARDRMGQMPLCYTRDRGRLIFASEVSALECIPDLSLELDPDAVDLFLRYGYVPAPWSIYRGVKKLMPAHVAVLTITQDDYRFNTSRYWSADFTPNEKLTSTRDVVRQLSELLAEATRMRMVSDVPLGAFLSGGIDSSLVVAYMAQASSRPIQTFTIGFKEREYDERQHANAVARRFNTEHHEFVVNPTATNVLPTLAAAFDEPFADSSALPTYYLAQLTRQHVTVALNGDGGDESFFGYERYAAMVDFSRLAALPPWALAVVRRGADLAPFMVGDRRSVQRIKDWLQFVREPLGRVYDRCHAVPVRTVDQLYTPNFMESLRTARRNLFETAFDAAGSDLPIVNKLLQADQQVYLPGDLLVKVDRMAMAHSLEARSPFLDHRIVEFAAQIPPRIKYAGRERKRLLKQLLYLHFSKSFVDRPKQGFGIPIAEWIRGPLAPVTLELCESAESLIRPLLDMSALRSIIRAHQTGAIDNSRLIWNVMCLEYWLRSRSAIRVGQ